VRGLPPSLVDLCLDNRAVSDASLRQLAPLTRLRRIDLFGASVSDSGAAALAAALPSLTSLELCGGLITNVGCRHLARIGGLVSLNLSQHGRVGTDGVRALAASLSQLRRISLDATAVDSGVFAELARLPSLARVSLCHTCVAPGCADALRERLPHVHIRCSGSGDGGPRA